MAAILGGWFPFRALDTTIETKIKNLQWPAAQERLEFLKERHPIPLPEHEVDGIAMLFMTYTGIKNGNLWLRWADNAYRSLESPELKTEEEENKWMSRMTNLSTSSEDLRFFVQYQYLLNTTRIQERVPPPLVNTLLTTPGRCFWGDLTPCKVALLRAAYNSMPSAQWFAVVSGDTVPFATFAHMREMLRQDMRNRIAISDMVMSQKNSHIKASNWQVLNRATVRILLDNPDKWVRLAPVPGGAVDEYYPLNFLLEKEGNEFLRKIKPGNLHVRGWPYGLDNESLVMYECWDECELDTDLPTQFKRVSSQLYHTLVSDPETWFGRKFYENSIVDEGRFGNESFDLKQGLTNVLTLRSTITWEPPKDDCPGIARFKSCRTEAELEANALLGEPCTEFGYTKAKIPDDWLSEGALLHRNSLKRSSHLRREEWFRHVPKSLLYLIGATDDTDD